MTITTQRTAKKYKAAQLIALLLFCIGTVLLVAHEILPGLLFFAVGAVVYTISRFKAWWNHG